jgi:hypothetical protein
MYFCPKPKSNSLHQRQGEDAARMSTSSPNKLTPRAKPLHGYVPRGCRSAGRRGSGSGCQFPQNANPSTLISPPQTKRARREPRGRACAVESGGEGWRRPGSEVMYTEGPLIYPTGRSRRVHARSTNARAVNAALCRGRTRPHPESDDESTHPEASPSKDIGVCGITMIAHLPRQRRRRAGWRSCTSLRWLLREGGLCS